MTFLPKKCLCFFLVFIRVSDQLGGKSHFFSIFFIFVFAPIFLYIIGKQKKVTLCLNLAMTEKNKGRTQSEKSETTKKPHLFGAIFIN